MCICDLIRLIMFQHEFAFIDGTNRQLFNSSGGLLPELRVAVLCKIFHICQEKKVCK